MKHYPSNEKEPKTRKSARFGYVDLLISFETDVVSYTIPKDLYYNNEQLQEYHREKEKKRELNRK